MRPKMRKIVVCLLIVAMFILTSCGKPSDMSDSTYSACKKIIECTDKYVNMDITYDQCRDKFHELNERIGVAKSGSTLQAQTLVLELQFLIIDNSISTNGEVVDTIINIRNDLATLIGEPKYKP